MPAWNKADFDDAYEFYPEARLGGHPNTRPQVSLHYHEHSMKRITAERWKRLLEVLPIVSSDAVVIVGAGFGWGVRELKNKTACDAIGTDISPYIQAEKSNDDSVEIDAEIAAVGLDPTTGRGLELRNAIATPGARAKENVINEDMATPSSRARVVTALGRAPTWILTEDIVDDDWTAADIVTLAGNLGSAGAQKVWLYTPTRGRSAADLATLTGHQVVAFGAFKVVG